jgi:hypothetical protein
MNNDFAVAVSSRQEGHGEHLVADVFIQLLKESK